MPKAPRVHGLRLEDLAQTSGLSKDDIRPRLTVAHGVPAHPSVAAWDPVHMLLAVGTACGEIVLFGKPAAERSLTPRCPGGVTHLVFLSGRDALLSLSDDGFLRKWDTRAAALDDALDLGEFGTVTCLEWITGTEFLLAGTDQGRMLVINLDRFRTTLYRVTYDNVLRAPAPERDKVVVAVCVQPDDDNRVLVGFAGGAIMVWDMQTRKAVQTYTGPAGLAALAWHKTGRHFAAGYRSGLLQIWNTKSELEPQSVPLDVGGPSNTRRNAIHKILWASAAGGDKGTLFVVGGTKAPDEPDMCVITIATPQVETDRYHIAHIGTVEDAVLMTPSPWPAAADDPPCLLVIGEDDALCFYAIKENGFPPIHLPSAFQLQEAPISTMSFAPNCPLAFQQDLRTLMQLQQFLRSQVILNEWPMKGGEFVPGTFDKPPAMVITGHKDGSVRFWDVSSVALLLSFVLDTSKIAALEPKNPCIVALRLCADARILVVGYSSGEVLVFRFRQDTEQLQKTDGFYCTSGIMRHEAPIQHMDIASGFDRLALVDQLGKLSITDLEDNHTVFCTNFESRITRTCLGEMTDWDTDAVIPLLFLGNHKAAVFVYNLLTGEQVFSVNPTNESPVVGLAVVDHLGLGVYPDTRPYTIRGPNTTEDAPQASAPDDAPVPNLDDVVIEGEFREGENQPCDDGAGAPDEGVSEAPAEGASEAPAPAATAAAAEETPGDEAAPKEEELAPEEEGAPAEASPGAADAAEGAPEGSAAATGTDDAAADPLEIPSAIVVEETTDEGEGEAAPVQEAAAGSTSALSPESATDSVQSLDKGGEDARQSRSRSFRQKIANMAGSVKDVGKDVGKNAGKDAAAGAGDNGEQPVKKERRKSKFFTISKTIGKNIAHDFGNVVAQAQQHVQGKSNSGRTEHRVEVAADGPSSPAAAADGAAAAPLDPHPPTSYMVQFCHNQIRIFAVPHGIRVHKMPLKKPITAGFALANGGDACLVTLDNDRRMSFYRLFDLAPIHSVVLDEIGCPKLTPVNLHRFAVSEDGRAIFAARPTELVRMSIFESENFIDFPEGLPTMHKPDAVMPAKPAVQQGFFKSLFGTSSSSGTQAVNHRELFDNAKLDSKEASYERRMKRATQQSAEATTAAHEAKDRLIERGEKLGRLDDKVAAMEDSSQQFLESIREYNRQQENKKWWQI